jgi:hypothetical protein
MAKMTEDEAREFFQNYKGVTIMGITYRPKDNKLYVGKNGSRKKAESMAVLEGIDSKTIEKETKATVLFGDVSYEKLVQNRQTKAYKELLEKMQLNLDEFDDQIRAEEMVNKELAENEFKSGARKNSRFITNTLGITEAGDYLVRVYFVMNNKSINKYFINGKEEPQFESKYKDYIKPPSKDSKKQKEAGVKKVIHLGDVGLKRIQQFTIDGETHEIIH